MIPYYNSAAVVIDCGRDAMPQPLPLAQRQELVRRHQQGEPLTTIADSLHAPYPTVRNWWRRFRDQGEAGLQTHYDRCGPQGPKAGPTVHQAALTLKREHPQWGGGRIRLELEGQFPDQPLPQVRALQRWFHQAGLQPARAKGPPVERQRAHAPHEVWQLDAKERLHLADGSGASLLTVTDEATGAILGAVPFPPVSLEPGGTAGGAGGLAGAVCPVGHAHPDPGG
jgi:transposase